jgi:UvrB/uvrC motif
MKAKIKFSNGEVQTILPLQCDISKIKKELEKKTGLIFGYGHLYYQTVGMLYAYMSFRTLEFTGSDEVIANVMYAMAYGLAENEGGIICYVENTSELLVYIPHVSGYHYIIRFQNKFVEMLETHNWIYVKAIELVETIEGMFPIEDLNLQLKKALETEDFELAAKLRDEISKKDKEE